MAFGGFGSYAEAVVWFFKWLVGRQDIANREDLIQGKKSQAEQDLDDKIAALTQTAMSDPDPKKRKAAIDELRKMDSE